jgi:hypothetical protein
LIASWRSAAIASGFIPTSSGPRPRCRRASTIVPGNLLLVQLLRLLQRVYTVAVFEKCMVAEYRQVRFRHIVDANVRLFLQAKVLSVTPTRGFVRVETACEIHFAESRRPALTATIVDLFYDAQ